jgi:CubicO group peptidase (beta-lactamase class C family)
MVRPRWPIAPTEGCLPGEVHDENARAMGGATGHAGLFGNAVGILKVAEQLVLAYHGWRLGVLKPETVRRLWLPSPVAGSTRTLGWDRPSPTGSSTGGRWPPNTVGHLGFTGTSIWIEPERALIVVLVTNRVCPTRANNMIRRLRPLLYDAAYKTWAKPKPNAKPSLPKTATTSKTPVPKSRAATPSTDVIPALPPDQEPTQRIPIPRGKQVEE